MFLFLRDLLFLIMVQSIVAHPLYAEPKVRIVMTVDWEGRNLDPSNLAAMRALRSDYPELPILHYLNAAYFTKPDAEPVAVREAMASVLLTNDQRGLHIHAWKSLITSAGVAFRNAPSLRDGNVPASEEECRYDCGHVIPLTVYNREELARIVAFSVKTLAEQGFGTPRHFRAGAWMLDHNVAEALTANGIVTDSSAVYAEFLKARWGDKPLYPAVRELWPEIRPTSQPYPISTAQGALWEMPDNGCLADYMTSEQMLQVVRENLERANKGGDTRLVVVGFHQETASQYLPRIRSFVDQVTALYGQSGEVVFGAMPKSFP